MLTDYDHHSISYFKEYPFPFPLYYFLNLLLVNWQFTSRPEI